MTQGLPKDIASLGWTDAFLLGYPPMDDTHREFVDLVDAMLAAGDEVIESVFLDFIHHAERHFEQERLWMEETAFPPKECHVDEHDAVMSSLRQVEALVSERKPEIIRSLARELVRWFPGHADYLDSALAQWMAKRRLGGVPVVLRRNVATPSTEESQPQSGGTKARSGK
jgi:hemerythrin